MISEPSTQSEAGVPVLNMGDCSETWIDKETESKWCGSKSPPGQGERLQLWILLLRNMECDGDRDNLGDSKGLSLGISSLLYSQTQQISHFLSLTVTHFPKVHRKTHSACTAVETQVQIVLCL